MKESFQDRYKKTCQLAESHGKDLAQIITESFDDLDSLGEFIDTLYYMHSISDDEQFALFLEIIYEILDCQMPLEIDFHLNSVPYLSISKSSRYFLIGNFAYLSLLKIPFSFLKASSSASIKYIL